MNAEYFMCQLNYLRTVNLVFEYKRMSNGGTINANFTSIVQKNYMIVLLLNP